MVIQYLRTLAKLRLQKHELKNIALMALGSMLEFYDLIIFSFMGFYLIRHIYNQQIFSHGKMLYLFSIFIIGYFARPFGMYIYNHFAIKLRIKWIQTINMLLLVCANLILAFASNNHFAWFTLSISLVILARIAQGLSGGIEMQAAFHYLSSRLKTQNINFAILGILAGYEIGQLLAILVNRLLHISFTSRQISEFGWRFSFLFGAVLTLVIYIIRCKYAENISKNREVNPTVLPAYKLFTYYPRQTLIACILSGMKGCTTFIYLVYIPFTLYQILKLAPAQISHYIMLSNLISLIFTFWLNKKINYRNLHLITAICCTALVPVAVFWVWAFTYHNFILIAIIPIAILPSMFTILVPRIISGLYPIDVRLYGVTFSYHSGFIIFAGIIPIITMALGFLVRAIFTIPDQTILSYIGNFIYLTGLSAFALYALIASKQLINYQDMYRTQLKINKTLTHKKGII